MSDIVIRIENLGKSYVIGHEKQERYTALRDVLSNKVKQIASKTRQIFQGRQLIAGNELEEFWALKDINFEIKQGDRLGIIGRNGAGKSTLLKVLSRITDPTIGRIQINGRIASLLEVGTGFHPELSGRENIYLNGAILGMNRMEIKKKFDEIVDFSGIEKFLDTPVKRYSSGMYVRLAFSVAANLESEILIVDEVLAVGDAEFQKKCLGKMDDVSKAEGRTVLFVSHNMAAVQNLCKTGVLLSNGKIEIIDQIQNVINKYLIINKAQTQKLSEITERKGNGNLRFLDGKVKDIKTNIYSNVETFSDIQFELSFTIKNLHKIINSRIDIGINNIQGDRVAWMSSDNIGYLIDISRGLIFFKINNLPLAPGDYNCTLFCEINNDVADWLFNVLPFSVLEKDYYGNGKITPANQGNILLNYSVC
jgi:lipopolysaccharide transport system ATP-binding protein